MIMGNLNSRAGMTAEICALESFSVDGRLHTSRQGDGAAATSVNSSDTRRVAGPCHLTRAHPFKKGRSAEVNWRYCALGPNVNVAVDGGGASGEQNAPAGTPELL